jgi:hypothetical protein
MPLQDNGGRICRSCLTKPVDGSMDIVRVVDWVVHKRLDHLVANNEPTGQAKLRKVQNTPTMHPFFHANACSS